MQLPLSEQVLAHVDQGAMIELASALVRIPSFKTEETPVARFLADFFRPQGYRVDLREIEPGRCVLISDMVKVTKVLALTAPDVCNRVATLHQANPA